MKYKILCCTFILLLLMQVSKAENAISPVMPTPAFYLNQHPEVITVFEYYYPILLFDQQTKWRSKILWSGNSHRKEIALTFDDGPHPTFTPALLKTLKEQNVRATFFLVGKMVRRYPDLVLAIVEDGHTIGNHSFFHENMTRLSLKEIEAEFSRCGNAIKDRTGQFPRYFRPPGGRYNREIIEIATARGYLTILWSGNAGDCATEDRTIIRSRILRNIQNGSIILMHDGVQATLDLLPEIIDYLKEKGYHLVTLDEMMRK